MNYLDISVIIVNYNTIDHVKKNVEHILKYTQNIRYEIIIVDNNSKDKKQLSEFADQNPSLKVILSENNGGFGSGCNIGAKNAQGKFLLFLNPDIIFNSNVIADLYETYSRLESPGALSGVLVNETGDPIYTYNDFPGLNWEFKEAFGFGIDKAIDQQLKKAQLEKPFKVDWVLGACIFISKENFLKAGGFDEDFFLYYEDTDLQQRLRKLGLSSYVDPKIKLFHHTKSSVENDSGQSTYNTQMNKNRLLYHKKHSSFLNYQTIRGMYLAGYLLRYVKYILSKDKKSLNYSSDDTKNIFKIYLNPDSQK